MRSSSRYWAHDTHSDKADLWQGNVLPTGAFFFVFVCLSFVDSSFWWWGRFFGWLSGSTSWQSGPAHPIRLAARPTRSSYSVFHITVDSWVGPGFPFGWLSGYQLADGPTRPPYSVAQVPIFLRVFRDRSQPSGKTKVSREDNTLWS